jgi:ABC-type nitrate/sulfonate/bicarbonate transport system substrate-binding protein
LPGALPLSREPQRAVRGWSLLVIMLLIVPPTWAETEHTEPEAAPTPLRLMLAWQPQAQFAGYYVAQARGFYREAGIEASILSMGHVHSPRAALEAGEVDLAVLWLSTAIKARAEGVPLVNVAQLFPALLGGAHRTRRLECAPSVRSRWSACRGLEE